MPFGLRTDARARLGARFDEPLGGEDAHGFTIRGARDAQPVARLHLAVEHLAGLEPARDDADADVTRDRAVDTQQLAPRSEEHTSELQSLMRISYAVFCLKKKKANTQEPHDNQSKQ